MRYHYQRPSIYLSMYGRLYICDHPVYSRCTLYETNKKGMAVIQQQFNAITKSTWWGELDPWLTDDLYLHDGFNEFFHNRASENIDSLYPTITIRQIMWALKMKPIQKERWETVFDRKNI